MKGNSLLTETESLYIILEKNINAVYTLEEFSVDLNKQRGTLECWIEI